MTRFVNLLAAALLSALVSVNVLAFMHARAMANLAETGEGKARPEQLRVFDKITVWLSGVTIPRPQNRHTPADLKLDYETHRFVSSHDSLVETWYIPGEDGLPLIALFHGYAASKSSLLTAAQVFHELGYTTVLVDFYGSGGSSGSTTTIGVREADDVAATVNYARRTWPSRRIVLYGISMGGAAVLRAIAVHGVKPDAIIIEATFDRLLNAGKNRFGVMGLPSFPFAELVLFWASIQNNFNLFSHNPVDYARSVHCPTLILHGEKDERVTLEQARTIAAALDTNVKFVQLCGGAA
jgi:dipeptidyl aminopeptidase/acylaminoacyl peptidase